MRKNGFLGLFGFFLVIIIIGCGGEDNDPEIYTVTIGTLTNGSITANPTSGVAGTEITLTIIPDDLYKLKKDSLKYKSTLINETILRFNLPAENIIINALFESIFIGNWKQETHTQIWTFLDDIWYTKNSEGKYTQKGTWIIENSEKKLILTRTHFAFSNDCDNINDLTNVEFDEAFYSIDEFIFEFISNSEWIIIGTDHIFTKIE